MHILLYFPGNILLITDPLTLTVNLHRLFRNNEPNFDEFDKIHSTIPSAGLIELKEKKKNTRATFNSINSIHNNNNNNQEENNMDDDDDVFFHNWENVDINDMDIKSMYGIHLNKEEFNSTFKRLYGQL